MKVGKWRIFHELCKNSHDDGCGGFVFSEIFNVRHREKAAVKDGAIVLKMNKIYGVAGFFIVLVSMAIIIISGLKTGEFSEEIKTIALPVIFLILGGILFIIG